MAITRLKKHDRCPVKAIQGPFGNHFGKLMCSRHNKHIQWLSEADYRQITGLKNDPSVTESNNAKQRLLETVSTVE